MQTISDTDLINFALTHVRYKFGGREFPYLDCWGFCRWFYHVRFGAEFPVFLSLSRPEALNTPPELAHIRQIAEPQDICIFGLVSGRGIFHTGIYIHGKFLHDSRFGCQIADSLPWHKAWFQAEELL